MRVRWRIRCGRELYHEINNFYTTTIYEKGAEVVRMLRVLLGSADFRKGMDLYFERHDGDAATIEQFVQCFADAAKRDLAQFMLLVLAGRHAGNRRRRRIRCGGKNLHGESVAVAWRPRRVSR